MHKVVPKVYIFKHNKLIYHKFVKVGIHLVSAYGTS